MLAVLTSTQFWAAIFGAFVGGGITFLIQLYLLRQARKQRTEDRDETAKLRAADRLELQQGLAHALTFKLHKIHSNLHGMHGHFWGSLTEGRAKDKAAEPWQVVVPLANPPSPIALSADEMGMLLSLKDDELFNGVMDLEAVHNSLIAAVHVFNNQRTALGERVAAVSQFDGEAGYRISGVAPPETYMQLRPKMPDVNGLVEDILPMAKDALTDSRKTVQGVNALFRAKLKLTHKVEIMLDADTTPTAAPAG
jgi:hypothetical protein